MYARKLSGYNYINPVFSGNSDYAIKHEDKYYYISEVIQIQIINSKPTQEMDRNTSIIVVKPYKSLHISYNTDPGRQFIITNIIGKRVCMIPFF